MRKFIGIILLGIIGLTSCSTLKTIKVLKEGEVEQKEFRVSIPFEYRLGLIVLKVQINGKDYDFILDTGAPNVVSKELAQSLNLNSKASQEVGDSQRGESNLEFASIEKISIGGINFLNTGVAIADLSASKEVACLNIDGFIGANLMKNAIWKFDYGKQMITVSNTTESLNIPEINEKIPFFTENTGTPIIDITLNNVKEKNVAVDLGYDGDIVLSKKTFKKLVSVEPDIPNTVSFGSSSSGLYGVGASDSIYFALVSDISFGDVSLKNTVVEFSNESSSIIGTNYFKHYDLIINWFDNEITLIKKEEYDNSTLSSYGFSFNNKNDSLSVGEIYTNSSAANQGLKINDIILEIDGVEYGELAPEQWCNIIKNNILKEKKSSIKIVVLRKNKKLTFDIKKTSLL